MRPIARFSIRFRYAVLAFWAIALAGGIFFAGGASDRLHGANLRIAGTESDRAGTILEREFGGTVSIAILLKGSPKDLTEYGPKVVRRLGKIEGVAVLSPWAKGGDRTLSEPAGEALISLQVSRPFQEIVKKTAPEVDEVLQSPAAGPLTYQMTGLAPLVRALNTAAIKALKKGELLALPVLLVLLLLIFRSPIAALVPAACGLVVTTIGMTVMGALASFVQIEALALSVVTMIGLALGVDYSLLIVSRFREELASGNDVAGAVEEAGVKAGHTVLFAGIALGVGMLGPLLIAPGALLVSATLAIIVAAALAVLTGIFLIPASLAVLGTNVNRLQFRSGGRNRFWRSFPKRVLLRPALAATAVLLPLLALSSAALGLDTGPPNVKNLPPGDPARASYESFERTRGTGWSTPYEITLTADGPITTTKRLRELKRLQDKLAKQPGVEAVMGPAALLEQSLALRKQGDASGTTKQLNRLADGLRRSGEGSGALVAGVGRAASGSRELAAGAQSATPRADLLAAGTKRLTQQAGKAQSGSTAVNAKAAQLAKVLLSHQAAAPALASPLERAVSDAQSALQRLSSLDPEAAANPEVERARQEITSALGALAALNKNLSIQAGQLAGLSSAAGELASVTARLAGGMEQLTANNKQAADGVAALAGSLPGFNAGINELSAGLANTASGSGQLSEGVRKMSAQVERARKADNRRNAELLRAGISVDKSTGSGYMVLAGVEGTRRDTQSNIGFALNTKHGGDTARVLVIPKSGALDTGGGEITDDIRRLAHEAGPRMGATGLLGGPAVVLRDFDEETSKALFKVVLALVVLTFVVLLAVFRSLVLALIAVALNLLTVGAALGVMVLLFQSDPPLLGGPGYLDAVSLCGIIGVIFGLSIDYEVFLIGRMLEGRALTGTTDGAIAYALEKTARVITGAALIMVGVFVAFAIAPVANIRQFGVGLTIAVVLDATVVRLVLLPTMVKLVGERAWPRERQVSEPPAAQGVSPAHSL